MTPKPCDHKFAQAEAAFMKAAENLQGAAATCVRQAGHDLTRACRGFQDQEISQLGSVVSENLKSDNFENVREACSQFASGRRGNLTRRDLSPEDLVVVAAMSLADACANLSGSLVDVISVGPDTVRSRHASEKVLLVLHAR